MSRTPRNLVWILAILAAVLALGACGEISTPAGQCQSDNDCGLQGVICFDHRVCIANVAQDMPVSLRVAPPSASGRLTEHFALTVQATAQASQISLMLADPAVVYGEVRRTGDESISVPGTLVATAPTDATATSLQFQTSVYNTAQHFNDPHVSRDYELRLQTGNVYDLAFYPQESTVFPPYYSTITVGGSIDDWKIMLPKAADLVQVTGRMTAGGEPLGAVRVYLQDASGRLTSTYDTTTGTARKVGSDTLAPGSFRLLVDPLALPSVLRVEAASGSAWPLHGNLGDYLNIAQAGLKKGPLDLGTLDLGGLGEPQTMEVHVIDAKGNSEMGAHVKLHQVLAVTGLDDAKVYLEASSVTDSAGVAKVSLPGGLTTVIVQPTAESSAGRWFGSVALKQGMAPLVCPKRVVLSGQVVDYVGNDVDKALVLLRKVGANPAESGTPGSNPSADPTFQATTDSDGRFGLPIDPGSWWLWVIPKANTKLPRLLAARVEIDGTSGPAPLLINVPAPLLVRGKVVTPSGAGVANAGVDVLGLFDLTPGSRNGQRGASSGDVDDPPTKTVIAQSHLLATTSTNPSGAFEVLIAPMQ